MTEPEKPVASLYILLIFVQLYDTLLHRFTRKCVYEVKIMAERNLVNLTITMTKEERKALKQIALNQDITVSALIRLWLEEHQNSAATR